MISPQELEAKVDARYRVFLIVWLGIFISVGLFLLLAVFVQSKGVPNPTLSYALLAIGGDYGRNVAVAQTTTGELAIEKSDVSSLQSAHIISLALCESSALFGLMDHFITGSNTSWLLFGVAGIGMLLHFPRKDHLRAVSYKPQ